ncbi:MAG: heroin esterase [Firmicutes bacterium]|nr:heroin esterase [Bacillota bacterium]
MEMDSKVHLELKKFFSVMPKMNLSDTDALENARKLSKEWVKTLPKDSSDDVLTLDKIIPGPTNSPEVSVRVFYPKERQERLPAVLWIHGGGYILGCLDLENSICKSMVREGNCVVVAVDYRLAPENPFPAGLEDCYAALLWIANSSESLGIDVGRIAVAGASAGGGLTAALALLARDRSGPTILFQMPLYPMIDDRNITPSSYEITDDRAWNRNTNMKAWEMYLGPNLFNVSPYAAPARAGNLSGLPPVYTCVGEVDLFRDEIIEYVAKLLQAGVPTEFHIYPGCFHACEIVVPDAEISKRVFNEYLRALARALHY